MENHSFNPNRPPSGTSVTLLGRIQDIQDTTAWEEFVTRYAPQIFRWCRRFSLQESDAADVTQEVLVKLVSVMQSFRYEPAKGSFRGWLKLVTSNVVRDMLRRRVRTASPLDAHVMDLLENESASSELANYIESAWQQEILEIAEARVQMRVQPHTWKAYQLTAIQDLSASETAQQLQLSIADIYVAKSRIIKMLRNEIRALSADTTDE